MYVNVGAHLRPDNEDIPTKAALKRWIQDQPVLVVLYETTMGKEDNRYNCNDLDIGVKYTVTGPNPYNNRKWYATVEKLPNGKITVK
jgi:hypothetical protein